VSKSRQRQYESTVIRNGHATNVISGGSGDTPSKAMMCAARSAIDKYDERIRKLRAG
jgi:hypothetical protein